VNRVLSQNQVEAGLARLSGDFALRNPRITRQDAASTLPVGKRLETEPRIAHFLHGEPLALAPAKVFHEKRFFRDFSGSFQTIGMAGLGDSSIRVPLLCPG